MLVYRYRELLDVRRHRYMSMVSLMSLYGNQRASLKGGNQALKEERRLALDTIPYYNAGKSRKTSANGRNRAVRLFRNLQKNVTPEMVSDMLEKTKEARNK